MKKLFLILVAACCSTFCPAQDKAPRKFNPREFQQRFEAFTSEQAGFTKEEAVKFFALYNAMKDKERAIYRKNEKILRSLDLNRAADRDVTKALNEMVALEAQEAKLEADFTKNVRKVVSDRKYLLFLHAEHRFHSRELRQMQRERAPLEKK